MNVHFPVPLSLFAMNLKAWTHTCCPSRARAPAPMAAADGSWAPWATHALPSGDELKNLTNTFVNAGLLATKASLHVPGEEGF